MRSIPIFSICVVADAKVEVLKLGKTARFPSFLHLNTPTVRGKYLLGHRSGLNINIL